MNSEMEDRGVSCLVDRVNQQLRDIAAMPIFDIWEFAGAPEVPRFEPRIGRQSTDGIASGKRNGVVVHHDRRNDRYAETSGHGTHAVVLGVLTVREALARRNIATTPSAIGPGAKRAS